MLNLFLSTVAKSKKSILFQELFKNQLKLYFETSSSCVQTKSEIETEFHSQICIIQVLLQP